MEAILSKLQKVGFSQYEAQAYVTLLQHAPVTGYELSKRSGVPRSMIYEVLGKLLDRGAAHLIPAETTQYTPAPARELLTRMRQNTEETFRSLEHSLETLEAPQDAETIRHIRGYDPVVAEILTLLEQAQRSVWLSLWHAEVALFDANTQGRNLGIANACMGDGEGEVSDAIPFYREHLPPREPGEQPESYLHIAVRDDEEVIIANFLQGSRPWAIRTQDRALVFLAKQLIQHNTAFAVLMQASQGHFNEVLQKHPYLKHMRTMEYRNRTTQADPS